jgi:hypothetical protein
VGFTGGREANGSQHRGFMARSSGGRNESGANLSERMRKARAPGPAFRRARGRRSRVGRAVSRRESPCATPAP